MCLTFFFVYISPHGRSEFSEAFRPKENMRAQAFSSGGGLNQFLPRHMAFGCVHAEGGIVSDAPFFPSVHKFFKVLSGIVKF